MLRMHLFELLNCRVQTESQAVFYSIYLSGGTAHDKALFAKCVSDFFDEIDNQRYICIISIKEIKWIDILLFLIFFLNVKRMQ